MKKNGYTVPELVIVIIIFGVVYFLVANNISYAFTLDVDQELYNLTIESIEKKAQIYGEANLDLFDEDKDIYLTVNDLIERSIIFPDKDGKIVDPRNENKELNNLKVKITLEEDNKVSTKVLK